MQSPSDISAISTYIDNIGLRLKSPITYFIRLFANIAIVVVISTPTKAAPQSDQFAASPISGIITPITSTVNDTFDKS